MHRELRDVEVPDVVGGEHVARGPRDRRRGGGRSARRGRRPARDRHPSPRPPGSPAPPSHRHPRPLRLSATWPTLPRSAAGFLQHPSTGIVAGARCAARVGARGDPRPGGLARACRRRRRASQPHRDLARDPLPELPRGVHAAADARSIGRSPAATSPAPPGGSRWSRSSPTWRRPWRWLGAGAGAKPRPTCCSGCRCCRSSTCASTSWPSRWRRGDSRCCTDSARSSAAWRSGSR